MFSGNCACSIASVVFSSCNEVQSHCFSVDSVDYLHQATNLKAHGSWYAGDWDMPHDDTMYSRRPPLYAIFLFLIQFISTNTFCTCHTKYHQCFFADTVLLLFWQLTGIRPVKDGWHCCHCCFSRHSLSMPIWSWQMCCFSFS
ncbi:MAG: hypothetical protein HS118_00925 [Bacteroidia bacterium]|nr:hypothetical protein [Bacteroidia bacterium]